ncbi:UNVERIFIED_CONTAM: hypothetical protein Sangu_0959600 [Sesamum angustifolium]|uniref:Uncharacterized protein n=1 Tax=Sesamum angustifolium TaxID=2727405 RepID=A0AAW2PFL8_9LAMI
MLQGEWVISRVFQKSGALGSSSPQGGGKKRPPGASTPIPEVIPRHLFPCRHFWSLPPPPLTARAAPTRGVANAKEHVP